MLDDVPGAGCCYLRGSTDNIGDDVATALLRLVAPHYGAPAHADVAGRSFPRVRLRVELSTARLSATSA